MKRRNPAPIIGGILLMVVGVIWFFQGIGKIPGSFMTGQIFWSWAGAVIFLVGLVALVRTIRRD